MVTKTLQILNRGFSLGWSLSFSPFLVVFPTRQVYLGLAGRNFSVLCCFSGWSMTWSETPEFKVSGCLRESHRQKAGRRVWGYTSLPTLGMNACLLSVTQAIHFLMKLFSTWNGICELGIVFLDIFGKGQIAWKPASCLGLRNLRQRHRLTWWHLPRWVGDHGVSVWDSFVPVSAVPASWAVSAMIAYWTH